MNVKTLLKRTQYFAYYVKKLDWPKFRKFFKYAKGKTGWSSFRLFVDTLKCVYQYNIGILDYFIFRFFEKNHEERDKWVGTGFKYEYDLIMNPMNTRHLLANKIDFYEAYKPFVIHSTCALEDIRNNNTRAKEVLGNPTGKIVVKDSFGQCGWDVEILNSVDYDNESLLKYMKLHGFNLAEEFIIQHPELASLSESGVNTIRIITQLNKRNEVEILGARLRISVNNHVDNLASGNIAAAIDLESGIVTGPGVYSDITKESVTYHPVSGIKLDGFQIPLWRKVLTWQFMQHYIGLKTSRLVGMLLLLKMGQNYWRETTTGVKFFGSFQLIRA
jgi:hypothetical protein